MRTLLPFGFFCLNVGFDRYAATLKQISSNMGAEEFRGRLEEKVEAVLGGKVKSMGTEWAAHL